VGDIIAGGIIVGAGIYDSWLLWQKWSENAEHKNEQCDVPTTPPEGLVENPIMDPKNWTAY
jgi:hypothetical protein